MSKLLFSIVLAVGFSFTTQAKLIYLIAPPRTLSTVFLRAVYARGDISVYNEPAEICYYKEHDSENYNGLPFADYSDLKVGLLQQAESTIVFAKDTPYACYECFFDDNEFILNPDVIFCFLIRDPHDSLVSFHKALGRYKPSETEWLREASLYEQHWKLFKKIAQLKGVMPLVITSEQLTENPEQTMQQFCRYVGVDYSESMVNWPSLKERFDPLEWHQYDSIDVCLQWYKNVIYSTHFMPCKKDYELDKHGTPTFVEINALIRQKVKSIYQNYLSFYKKLTLNKSIA